MPKQLHFRSYLKNNTVVLSALNINREYIFYIFRIGKYPKKKKQKKKPHNNRVWIRPQVPMRPRPLMSLPVYPRTPSITAPTRGLAVFQAPHQQPETIIDLFDDTASSTPLLKTPLTKAPLLKTPLLNTPRVKTPLLKTPAGIFKPVIQEAVRPSEADQLT